MTSTPAIHTIALPKGIDGTTTIDRDGHPPLVVDNRVWAIAVQLAYAGGWSPEGAIADALPRAPRVGYLEAIGQRVSGAEARAIGKGILKGLDRWRTRKPGEDTLVMTIGVHSDAQDDRNWLTWPQGTRGALRLDLFQMFRATLGRSASVPFEEQPVVLALRELATELKRADEFRLRYRPPAGWVAPGTEMFLVEVVAERGPNSGIRIGGQGPYRKGDRVRVTADQLAAAGHLVQRLREDGTPITAHPAGGCPNCAGSQHPEGRADLTPPTWKGVAA